MQNLEHTLASVFGLSAFRPYQCEVIQDVLDGHDVVCVMPTGAGKSLCFQLPAVALGGLTLVVSPLISLMADQVRQLQALRIPALLLNSSQDGAAYSGVVRQLREGFQGLLYISPERFAVPAFQELLQKIRPKLFVVDEAHCISAWGHDFRPDYMRLAEAREQLGSPLTIAVTATATAQVRDDISRVLKLRLPKVHVTGFDRENLAYGVMKFRSEAKKDAVLISLLDGIEGAAIVYCSTRRAVEQLAAWCEERFPERPVCAYHAGMPQEARGKSQELFVSGADTIVVATNAFGMGINRADIRLVAHYNLPGSVEAYYQEAGRAGRDGKPARCVLLYEPRDLFTQKFFIDKMGENNPNLSGQDLELLQRAARRKLDRMLAYADSLRCRRKQIVEYFGQAKVITNCTCDGCGGAAGQKPKAESSGSYRDRSPVTTTTNASEVPAYVRKSQALRSPAVPVRARIQAGKRSKPTSEEQRQKREHLLAELDGASQVRFERLRRVRLELAKKRGWPAYCILPERNLREVARLAPASLDQFAKIVGEKRAAEYGQAFLDAVGSGGPPR
jgi:RecQ family ATP-dependent DNA helicase